LVFIVKEFMPQVILTESQLEIIKSVMVLEKTSDAKTLNEDNWKNDVLSLVGIVDPTGIADLINAISYYRQGDNLYAFLSLISVVPYIGDALGKSVMGAMKVGGKTPQLMRAVSKAVDAGDTVKAQKYLNQIAKSEGALGTFARKGREWAPKVDEFIDRIPGGAITRGFKNTIKEWVRLFRGVGTEAASLAKRLPTKSAKQQQELIQGLESLVKREKFLDPTILNKPNFLQRFFYGGGLGAGRVSDLWRKGNMKIRVLMGKTKFYLGFLDYLGVANFVGPDELEEMVGGEDELLAKMEKYEKTPEAQTYLQEDFPKVSDEVKDDGNEMSLGTQKMDMMGMFMNTLIKGPMTA
jgi:hypothetical protein